MCVCLFVSLSARISQKPLVQISPNFQYALLVTVASVLLWRRTNVVWSISPGGGSGGYACRPYCIWRVIISKGRCYAPECRGRTFVNRLCPRICDNAIYFIHQIAIHNATKLLPLTNQTKLTLTVTLTLTDTVTVIFLHAFRWHP